MMASHEELVDLSLFAESPTNDWRFASLEAPSHNTDLDSIVRSSFPPFRQDLQSESHASSHVFRGLFSPIQRSAASDRPSLRHTSYERRYYDPPDEPVVRPLPRSYSEKPLPPPPPKKLCKPRPSRGRHEAQSRCILQRLKKTRSEDLRTDRRGSLQQRRNLQSAPQLTLTVPRQAQRSHRPANEMIWLPNEQMWLVMNQHEQNLNLSPPQYSRAPVRSQPSPSIYSYIDTPPPVTPDAAQSRNPFINEDGLSPIQSQFRSLIVDEERRSPLFQEATQTIQDIDSTIEAITSSGSDDDWPVYDPAMYESPTTETLSPETPPPRSFSFSDTETVYDPAVYEPPTGDIVSPESPHTPTSSFDDVEREWNSAVSVASSREGSGPLQSRDTSYQSYHSAVSSIGGLSKDEDPVDFYLGNTPVWAGIAKSLSGRTSTGTSLRNPAPSSVSYEPSLSNQSLSRQPLS